jgi:AcrR family transcriptional regulator
MLICARMAQPATRALVIAAARALITGAPAGSAMPSVGAVAAQAGVSRLTVYHHFGSKAGLVNAVAAASARRSEAGASAGPPRSRLRHRIEEACTRWAADPLLFRRLPASGEPGDREADRQLALDLAAADELRPGCSLKEAEDVIGLVTSFAAFDRFHADGRRAVPAVVEILCRLAGTVLAAPA